VRGLGCVLWLAACGRIDFDAVVQTEPERLDVLLSAGEDDDPSLTADQREIYFNSDRSGANKIYRAVRASVTSPWSAPEVVTELEGDGDEDHPAISPDGLRIVFSSDRPPSTGNDLWMATRENRQLPFGPAFRLEALASADDEENPFIDSAMTYVYFSSDRDGTTSIYVSRRTDEVFGMPVKVMTQGSAPWVNGNETVLCFGSSRTGDQDIWCASRDTAADAFAAPAAIVELDDGHSEEDPWLSADATTIYFASNRGGNVDLYTARVSVP
jgi:Tol biopolymer transport system component